MTETPEVLEAQWDRDKVRELFDDLARGAEVKHVHVRTAGGGDAQDSAVTLERAKQLFDDGQAKAIQIYYDFEQKSWCDTLMVAPDEVRIIRTSGRHLQ